MKNKRALVYGIFIALIGILFLKELFQSLFVSIFNSDVSIEYHIFYITSSFKLSLDFNSILYIMICTSSFLFIILLVEIGNYLLKKSPVGIFRFSLVIFLLINIGYLIINVFYGAITSILYPEINTDWNLVMIKLGLTGGTKIVFMFFVILILTGYLNLSARRVTKYINSSMKIDKS